MIVLRLLPMIKEIERRRRMLLSLIPNDSSATLPRTKSLWILSTPSSVCKFIAVFFFYFTVVHSAVLSSVCVIWSRLSVNLSRGFLSCEFPNRNYWLWLSLVRFFFSEVIWITIMSTYITRSYCTRNLVVLNLSANCGFR